MLALGDNKNRLTFNSFIVVFEFSVKWPTLLPVPLICHCTWLPAFTCGPRPTWAQNQGYILKQTLGVLGGLNLHFCLDPDLCGITWQLPEYESLLLLYTGAIPLLKWHSRLCNLSAWTYLAYLPLFAFLKNCYLFWERERENESRGGADGGRENPKQSPHCQHQRPMRSSVSRMERSWPEL